MFDLVVSRKKRVLDSGGTFGELSLRTYDKLLDSYKYHRVCYTLEPHNPKVPFGTYDLIMSPSPKFKKVLPYVQNVPGHTGIRIHSGNVVGDTDGCLLVGLFRDYSHLYVSRPAVDMVISIIRNFKVNKIIYE